MYQRSLCWFRRDLRLDDHAALTHALLSSKEVIGVFVFDTTILNPLPENDRRIAFIWDSLQALRELFRQHNGALYVVKGDPTHEVPHLASTLNAQAVFTNHDYEPSAITRDETVADRLAELQVLFHTFKDHVVFEIDEVLTQQRTPFTVFTPYKRAWLNQLNATDLTPHASRHHLARLNTSLTMPDMPSLEALGFGASADNRMDFPAGTDGAYSMLDEFLTHISLYDNDRNFPAKKGTSRLSVHFRFGTLSIREAARLAHTRAQQGNTGAATWLSELIWRDFFIAILAHFPHVVTHPFRPAYEALNFSNRNDYFEAWKQGQTGYPIVDAGMRQLNQTGFMHNRLRMVTASFLVKHLGIDWRWGEAYFARQLNDFDLAANNGGWQWCASTGCDAQPYFRIFNPVLQSQKFDPEGVFIRQYIPELGTCPTEYIHTPWKKPLLNSAYAAPIVNHAMARIETLERYGSIKTAKTATKPEDETEA